MSINKHTSGNENSRDAVRGSQWCSPRTRMSLCRNCRRLLWNLRYLQQNIKLVTDRAISSSGYNPDARLSGTVRSMSIAGSTVLIRMNRPGVFSQYCLFHNLTVSERSSPRSIGRAVVSAFLIAPICISMRNQRFPSNRQAHMLAFKRRFVS